MRNIDYSLVIDFLNKHNPELVCLFEKEFKKSEIKDKKMACKHIFTKGKEQGNVCNSNLISDESIKQGYCKKHLKKDPNKTIKSVQKKIELKENKSGNNDINENKELNDKEKKVLKKIEKPSLIIKRNENGYFEHSETGLIFNKDKKVRGRKGLDNEIHPLTEDDKVLCEKYGFIHI